MRGIQCNDVHNIGALVVRDVDVEHWTCARKLNALYLAAKRKSLNVKEGWIPDGASVKPLAPDGSALRRRRSREHWRVAIPRVF